jgi:hypothetical protein
MPELQHEFISSDIWIEQTVIPAVKRRTGIDISPDFVKQKIPDFIVQITEEDGFPYTLKLKRTHFINWIAKHLQKNDKRSIDNENKIQRGLFDELEVKPEIVRIEVRLSEYRKLKKTLDEIGFKEDVKFNRMFSEKLSQKITKLYWDMVTENSKICFLPTSEPKQILEQIAIKFPKSKPFKKLQMVAMVVLANSGNGITELRNILFKGNSDRSWYRIVSDYKTLTESLLNLNPRDWYKQIEEQLENYKKINIKK